MLRPVLRTLDLTPDVRRRIEPTILDALFGHLEAHHPPTRKREWSLSITRAKEILELAQPLFRERITEAVPAGETLPDISFRATGELLHGWLDEAAAFFRREGAPAFREALAEPDTARREGLLWAVLFHERLLPLLLATGYLRDRQRLETLDLVVESLRVWASDLSSRLDGGAAASISPQAFFLDSETDLAGPIEWNGRILHLHGRPDALVIDRATDRPQVIEYKFGLQGQLELQIAQTLLYRALVDAAKGPGIESARLVLFRLEPEAPVTRPDAAPPVVEVPPRSEFPERVVDAFAGYIGNQAAVRRLKIECTLALREGEPPRMPLNFMFCGPGGLGKTELARRVAKALGLPLVDVPADGVRNVDALLERIDKTLAAEGQKPRASGTDSGLPRLTYPPVVVFLDEVHQLGRKADLFLNFFEPREKRAVGKRVVGDFRTATVLAATTDIGLLPGAFLTRFAQIDLVPYTAEQVAEIIHPVFASAKKSVSGQFLVALARMSRLNPRIALERAGAILRLHQFEAQRYPLTVDGLRAMSEENWRVDENGLRDVDHHYLRALVGVRRGVAALTQLLPVGREEIVNVIEPYLLQLRAVRMTAGGRELTERGELIAKTSSE